MTMDQPAPAPFKPAVSPTRRRNIIIIAVVSCVLLFGGGTVGIFWGLTRTFAKLSQEPWALVKEAGAAARTEEGARTFYQSHPGLARRYTTDAAFVEASRGWPAKVAKLPPVAPDLWSLFRSGGGAMNINSSNGKTTFSLKNHQGVNVEVVTANGALEDLVVE
jgi:hypothetical protein